MTWESIAALTALVVAVASGAYTFGVVATRQKEHEKLTDSRFVDLRSEIERARDRLDGFMDYWKKQ